MLVLVNKLKLVNKIQCHNAMQNCVLHCFLLILVRNCSIYNTLLPCKCSYFCLFSKKIEAFLIIFFKNAAKK